MHDVGMHDADLLTAYVIMTIMMHGLVPVQLCMQLCMLADAPCVAETAACPWSYQWLQMIDWKDDHAGQGKGVRPRCHALPRGCSLQAMLAAGTPAMLQPGARCCRHDAAGVLLLRVMAGTAHAMLQTRAATISACKTQHTMQHIAHERTRVAWSELCMCTPMPALP